MVTVPSVSCQLWCPKVSKGERREAGIQWIQPPKAVSDPKFRQTTSGAHGSANRADCLPRGKPFGAPAGARLFPCRGTDAPTPAREQSLQPYGAFTLFFRWRKKSVQKKASGTATPEAARPASRNSQISAFRALPCPALVFAQACQSLTAFGSCAHWAHAPSRPKLRSAVAPLGLSSTLVRFAHPPGKSPLLPIFERGSSQCRAQHNWTANMNVRARSCSPFSAVKIGGPFSLRCLSPLCFAAGDAGQTQTAMLGMLRCDRDDSTARKNRLDFYSVVGINRTQIMSVWIFRHILEFPET